MNGNHKYEPRYSGLKPEDIEKILSDISFTYTKSKERMRDKLNQYCGRTHVYDICVHCGDKVSGEKK